MTIEPAQPRDIPRLVHFQQEMAYETEGIGLSGEKVRQGIEAMFASPEKGRYFVARLNDQVVGCLMITTEWSEWRNSSIIWIQSVFVEKQFRRQGIYRALYNHVKRMVERDEGYDGIRLYVDRQNEKAQQVYKSLGMTDEHYLLFEWINK